MATKKTTLEHPELPNIGPYSFGVQTGDWVFLSGQLGLDLATKKLVDGDMAVQLRQIFHNVTGWLQSRGWTLEQVIKITVYVTDLSQFSVVNTIFMEQLTAPYPARTTIEVSRLPLGAAVELDFILSSVCT